MMFWAQEPATDFWLYTAASTGPLGGAQADLLSEHGWTTTSLSAADGAAADFMTSDDVGTIGGFVQNAQNDLLKSSAIFGDYAHARMAADLLHRRELPRYLIMDAYARFSVVANNQPTTALGFVEDGGSIVTAADHAGAFTSNTATWGLSVDGSEGTAFGTADTGAHLFRIVLDRENSTVRPGVDGTMYDEQAGGVDGSLAIVQDEFPVAFGAGSGGANNLVQLTWAHIFYAYRIPHFWL
jgi:hypothetical protein